MKEKDILAKELFEMVYKWGGYGVVVDETAPAYKRLINKLVLLKAPEGNSCFTHNVDKCDNCRSMAELGLH